MLRRASTCEPKYSYNPLFKYIWVIHRKSKGNLNRSIQVVTKSRDKYNRQHSIAEIFSNERKEWNLSSILEHVINFQILYLVFVPAWCNNRYLDQLYDLTPARIVRKFISYGLHLDSDTISTHITPRLIYLADI